MPRTLVAVLLPAGIVVLSWLRLETRADVGRALAVAALAVVPALLPGWRLRAVGVAAASVGAAWIAFAARPWELVPSGDDPQPVVDRVSAGLADFYAVLLPFAPDRHPEMQALVLLAIFGFVAALGLLVAEDRPLAAAAVAVAGACWPATLLDASAWEVGVFALAGVLWIFLARHSRNVGNLATGAVTALVLVVAAAWITSATPLGRNAAFQWQRWDLGGPPASALGVRFVWNASYDGVSFPRTKTEVLEIRGLDRREYWRASTLDLFTSDRWVEDLYPTLVSAARGQVPGDPLTPARARDRGRWVEQKVTVRALVDDHVVAAGTPAAIDAPRLGSVFFLSGGVVRARRSLDAGTTYRVWSYVADPSRKELAAAPASYPAAARRFLTVSGRALPPFAAPGREESTTKAFADPAYPQLAPYRPLYDVARRVVGDAQTPYAAVVALESWLRRGGGFRYAERPPQAPGVPPLVGFVTRTHAGYCQHFAGAMALMLRTLGVPARVAVGFTSGSYRDGAWRVTDHDAHAWVEVWFPRFGWVPFDPTPGRGTFAGSYSIASQPVDGREALPRGDRADAVGTAPGERGGARGGPEATGAGRARLTFLIGLAALAAAAWTLLLVLAKTVRRGAGRLTRDPRRSATATRRELEGYLRDQGVDIPASATLAWLGHTVYAELGVDAAGFAEAAAHARFGPPQGAPAAASRARAELGMLVGHARREMPLLARARGLYSLRSLRTGDAR